MPWPIADAWNQHLDEMNRRNQSCQVSVSFVRLEAPFEKGWPHTEHVHPYWQLELVEHGGFSVSFGRKEIFPEAGDILLIPPQNWHYFHQEGGKGAWSVKFAVPEMEERYPVGLLPRSEASGILHGALLESARLFARDASDSAKMIFEHLIAASLELYCSARQHKAEENELVREVRRLVEAANAACKPITVSEIAAGRGCSTVYLNRVFKRCLGVPVKVYIDQYRFETARRLLLESSLNITEIAAEMGFDDVFRFSRFFRRMGGESPGKFKKSQLDAVL